MDELIGYYYDPSDGEDYSCVSFVEFNPNKFPIKYKLIHQFFGKDANKAYILTDGRNYVTQEEFDKLMKRMEGDEI